MLLLTLKAIGLYTGKYVYLVSYQELDEKSENSMKTELA